MNEPFLYFVEFLKSYKEITTKDLIKACYESPNLPSNISNIYFLISLANSYEILNRIKKGFYVVDSKKLSEFLKKWGSDERLPD